MYFLSMFAIDDGMVSMMEFKASSVMLIVEMAMSAKKVPGVEMLFKAADANTDDMLSMDELKAAVSKSDTNSELSSFILIYIAGCI